MKVYEGRRGARGARVTVRDTDGNGKGVELRARRDLRNHSPAGFEWGYNGSGPAQLALAILADALDDDERAMLNYQRFKQRVIAAFDCDTFRIDAAQVRAHVEQIENERDGFWAEEGGELA